MILGHLLSLAKPGFGVRPEFDADFAYHFGLSKPVVAAINGPAAGVGLVLACYADLRFAAAGAKFTTAHGKLNLPAEFGLSWLLPKHGRVLLGQMSCSFPVESSLLKKRLSLDL